MGIPDDDIFAGASRYLERVDILSRREDSEGKVDPASIYSRSFEKSFGMVKLARMISDKNRIGLVINDNNRPTPSYLALEHMLQLDDLQERISKVHIATGSHKKPSENDLEKIMGRSYDILSHRIHIHDSRDREAHVHYGRTKRSTELYFDRELEGHDLYIFINSVEPHYFAGFTGGRKSLLPGMALYDTIEMNHSHALSVNSRTIELAGNPVHEDMEEAAGIFLEGKKHLSIQIVQGPGKIITGVTIGDIFTSFREAIRLSTDRFCIPVDRKYDIVISVARPPMDRTLYQAHKAIENGKLALRDGGVIILVAPCSEGIGQSTFWDLLTMSSDPDEILKMINEKYVLGYHKAARIVQLSRISHIYAVSDLSPTELSKGFIEGFKDLGKALESAMSVVGEHPDILIIPDGAVSVPLVRSDEQ